jgi:hypothetical protein
MIDLLTFHCRLKSSFFCMIWVFFPMLGRFILERVYDRTAIQRKPKDWKWLVIHLLSLTIPLTMMMYLIYMTFLMFIPIMGRYGSSANPEFLIGWKSTFMTLATLSFICPLFMVMNKTRLVPSILTITTIISVIIGMISHKKSLITIFGHKHKIKNFIQKGVVNFLHWADRQANGLFTHFKE